MPEPITTLAIDLTPRQADALAQLCKRFRFDIAQQFVSPFDSGAQASELQDAVGKLQIALAQAGYDPR